MSEQRANPEPAARKRSTAWATTTFSAVALLFSAFSLWESRLKNSDLRIFVPPVIQYSAPHQNSNFEVVAIPVTIANEGARAGTVLSLELAVTDPKTGQTKRFYSADFGRWTVERSRSGAFQPFAPIVLPGYSSRTETVLFYTRGEAEQPPQIIRETQPYRFTLTLDEAVTDDGPFDRLLLARADVDQLRARAAPLRRPRVQHRHAAAVRQGLALERERAVAGLQPACHSQIAAFH